MVRYGDGFLVNELNVSKKQISVYTKIFIIAV